jgi:hypothetical protein
MHVSVKTAMIGLIVGIFASSAHGGDVNILSANFEPLGGNIWAVDVTLEHADSGWDHYADAWRVVDTDGKILGTRVLLHPHEDEQPFTRGLYDVEIPSTVEIVYIEAHELVHGWTPNRLEVELSR